MKSALKRLIRDEKGQLGLVLVFLVVGGLIITPLLGLMTTGLITGQMYENTMHGLYAADAGIEDGLWQIENLELAVFLDGYDEYDYYSQWPYSLNESINDHSVNVTIANVWMPKDIAAPDPDTARDIAEDTTLLITGSPSLAGGSQYEIKISYNESCGGLVNAVGIWLPPGFEYAGNCSLKGEEYYSVPDIYTHKGGYAVVWDFISPVPFTDFSDSFTFEYIGPGGERPYNAVSWIYTSGGGLEFPYTWDADVKVYKIISTATATDPNTGKNMTVESYSNRIEQRKLGSAISGDYHAIGNTLMTPTGGPISDSDYRDVLFEESSATVKQDDIPSDATIEAAWLYWSGWIDGISIPFSEDSCVEDAKVNQVIFNGNNITVALDKCQEEENIDVPGSWSYSCVYNATQIVRDDLDPDTKSGNFTLGHWLEDGPDVYQLYDPDNPSGAPVETTGYPLGTPALSTAGQYELSYAGWSLIIIYSSPATKGHQLYLFDTLRHVRKYTTENFTISNFLAPDPIEGEEYAAHMTCFVGDGDEHWHDDFIAVNPPSGLSGPAIPDDYKLWDGTDTSYNDEDSPNNVWNSQSAGLDLNGIDIDNFDISWNSGLIKPGDTSANVILESGYEIYTFVYIILSFRSEITSGGIIGYLIRS